MLVRLMANELMRATGEANMYVQCWLEMSWQVPPSYVARPMQFEAKLRVYTLHLPFGDGLQECSFRPRTVNASRTQAAVAPRTDISAVAATVAALAPEGPY